MRGSSSQRAGIRPAIAVVALCAAGLAAASAARVAAEAPVREPLFAVEFTLGPAWVAGQPFERQLHAGEHSANLRRLRQEGRLLLGGRYGAKGWILLRAGSLAAARAELDRDPAVAAGVFAYAIEEFRPFYDGCTSPPAPLPGDGGADAGPAPAPPPPADAA